MEKKLEFIANRRFLDVVIIPTAPSFNVALERANRALTEYNRGENYLVISGMLENGDLKSSQRKAIYDELRKYGVRPANIKIEGNARDSIENIVNSFEKIEKYGGKNIGIASNPSHLDRLEDIFNRAKEEKIIGNNFCFHRIQTKETLGSRIYGGVSRVVNKYKMRNGLKEAKNYQTPKWIKYLGRCVFGAFK